LKIGRLLLRLVVGGLFIGHGTQKLFGWFGGHRLDATAQGFERLGLRPGPVRSRRRDQAPARPDRWALNSSIACCS
jgi:uncharacterized membrane protein YphA (DoxX/SURF4 family)